MLGTLWLFRSRTPGRVDRVFRRGQLVSAAAYSLGHGTNDAQKTMGIIAVLLFSTGHLGPEFYVPFWVVLAAHAALALIGTAVGGILVSTTQTISGSIMGSARSRASPRCGGASPGVSCGRGS
jgi:phosphate/sulfate permease